MEQLRAYKFRLYPNKTQAEYLNQNFGAVRFVWNQLVAAFNSWSSMGPNPYVTEKTLKDSKEFPWLKEAISYTLQQKRLDFEEFKKQFFNKKRACKLGQPKFKKKGVSNDSFRIPGASMGGNACIDFEEKRIRIPKLGWTKIVFDRTFKGELRQCTFSKNRVGQYFVSILVKEDVELKQNTGRSVGIDLGLNHFLVLDNGIKIENPRWFRESQAELKRAQQHLSRKQTGSNRREFQRLKVAKIYLKIANQRKYFHHVVSSWLVDNYDHIFTENLNIKGMKKSNSAKSVSDAGWASFISMLDYKSKWYGRGFQKVGRFFPSSKTCSACGAKETSFDWNLGIREWTCSGCGHHHDRDINAAKNIKIEGFGTLYDLSSEELSDYRRREAVRPKELVLEASSLKRLAIL